MVLKLKIVVWKVTLVRGIRQTLMPLCPGGNHKGILTQRIMGKRVIPGCKYLGYYVLMGITICYLIPGCKYQGILVLMGI